MIAAGSMVVLKGHHLHPMVVRGKISMVNIGTEGGYVISRDAFEDVEVEWLDTFGVPHTRTYPLALLEEIDG